MTDLAALFSVVNLLPAQVPNRSKPCEMDRRVVFEVTSSSIRDVSQAHGVSGRGRCFEALYEVNAAEQAGKSPRSRVLLLSSGRKIDDPHGARVVKTEDRDAIDGYT